MNKIVKLGNYYLLSRVSYLLSLSLLVELYKYVFLIFLLYLLIYSLDFSPLYCDSISDLPVYGNESDNATKREYKEFFCFRFKFKDKCKFNLIKDKFTN